MTKHGIARTCNVEGCDKPHQARGLCWRHYQQARRHGAFDAAAHVAITADQVLVAEAKAAEHVAAPLPAAPASDQGEGLSDTAPPPTPEPTVHWELVEW